MEQPKHQSIEMNHWDTGEIQTQCSWLNNWILLREEWATSPSPFSCPDAKDTSRFVKPQFPHDARTRKLWLKHSLQNRTANHRLVLLWNLAKPQQSHHFTFQWKIMAVVSGHLLTWVFCPSILYSFNTRAISSQEVFKGQTVKVNASKCFVVFEKGFCLLVTK